MQKYLDLKTAENTINFYNNIKKEKEKEKLDNITNS
jgi:hypothetical protein